MDNLKVVGHPTNSFLVAAMHVVKASEIAQGLKVKSFELVSGFGARSGGYSNVTRAIGEAASLLEDWGETLGANYTMRLVDRKSGRLLVTIRSVGNGIEVSREGC